MCNGPLPTQGTSPKVPEGCDDAIADARRFQRDALLTNALLYLGLFLVVSGWMPGFVLAMAAPILIVRWLFALHELFHLRSAQEVDPITRLLPLAQTPLALGYREYRAIHGGHHRHMATPADPEWYQLRGSPLWGLVNAMTVPEQAFFRWVQAHGFDGPLVRGTVLRFALFVGLIMLSGPAFFWYWIPVRLSEGLGYFSFFYRLHRQGESYGVYAFPLTSRARQVFRLLFGRDACAATCHHDIHHAYPHAPARILASLQEDGVWSDTSISIQAAGNTSCPNLSITHIFSTATREMSMDVDK